MPAKPGPLRPHEERRTYARHEPVEPPPGTPALGDSFLIVTEGAVTEKRYFEEVRSLLKIHRMTVHVVHPEHTDAVGLVHEAMRLRDELNQKKRGSVSGHMEVEKFDHVWVLFDTDVPTQQSQLEPALELAKRENIHVGHSTPSVEVWLLLHFRNRPGPFLNSQAAEKALEQAWGQSYDKSTATFSKLWPIVKPNIPMAVQRAEQTRQYHRADEDADFPPNPSTEVDLLVRALDASVRQELRIL